MTTGGAVLDYGVPEDHSLAEDGTFAMCDDPA